MLSSKFTSLLCSALLAILSVANAHVTLNPNFGAGAGSYFKTTIKIPHGTMMKETTKVVVRVPHGILSVKPESRNGWNISIAKRSVTPYISHGHTVNTAPDTITWTAECTGSNAPSTCDNSDHDGLHNDHLLELGIQVKLGCDFGRNIAGDATDDATIWSGQHTLWWRTEQYVSTPGTNDGNLNAKGDMLSWTGAVSGDASWGGAQPKPSPYTFIYSTSKCKQPDSTGSTQQEGMRWGVEATVITPATDQEAVRNKAEVISIIEEQLLNSKETSDAHIALIQVQAQLSLILGTASLAVSATLAALVFAVAVWRHSAPENFRHFLLASVGETTPVDGKI